MSNVKLLLVTVIILNLIYSSRGSNNTRCLLHGRQTTNNQTVIEAKCDYRIVDIGNNGEQHLILEHCNKASLDVINAIKCNSIYDKQDNPICFVSIELNRVANFERLILPNRENCIKRLPDNSTTTTQIKFNLTISDIPKLELTEKIILFTDIERLPIEYFKVQGIGDEFNSGLIMSEHGSIENIEFTNVNSKGYFRQNSLDLISQIKLKSVEFKSSNFLGFSKGSFRIVTFNAPKTIELKDIELKNGFETGAIYIRCKDLLPNFDIKSLTITITGLRVGSWVGDFYELTDCGLNKRLREFLKVNFVIKGNKVNDVKTDLSIFKPLAEDVIQGSLESFQFDDIQCCADENRWLFDLYEKYDTTKGSKIFINCTDIEGDFRSYPDQARYEEACVDYNKHKLYPIITIAIILIFLLAILMLIFAYICFYHILPKRDNAIIINSLKRSTTSTLKNSSSGPSQQTTTISTAKKTSDDTLEAKSTKTDIANASPLLSTETKVSKQQGPKQLQSPGLPKKRSSDRRMSPMKSPPPGRQVLKLPMYKRTSSPIKKIKSPKKSSPSTKKSTRSSDR